MSHEHWPAFPGEASRRSAERCIEFGDSSFPRSCRCLSSRFARSGLRPMKTPPSPHASTGTRSAAFDFIRLTREIDRKEFYQSLTVPKWWTGGGPKDAERGWIEVFKRSDWKCIYCSTDLAANTDALAESTEEHLVPRSLLEANGINPSMAHNMAACCAGCNGLKNEHLPPANHACWRTRRSFIRECQRFIAERRLRNFQKYRAHVENVLKRRAGHAEAA